MTSRALAVGLAVGLAVLAIGGPVRGDDLGYDRVVRRRRTVQLARGQIADWAKQRGLPAVRRRMQAALAREPLDDTARYALACVLVAQGELEPAAAELEALLRRDLPRFALRLEEDEELATLRASPHGERLRRLVATLGAAWRTALAEGVPASARIEDYPRAGVYLGAVRRFLPATAPDGFVYGTLVDGRRGLAAVLTGLPQAGGLRYMLTGRRLIVTRWAGGAPSREQAVLAGLDEEGYYDDLHEVSTTADAVLERDVVFRNHGRVRWGAWQRVAPGRRLVPAEGVTPDGPTLVGWPHSGVVRPPAPAGWRVEGTALVGPRPEDRFELGAAHARPTLPSSIAVSPDGRFVAVVSLHIDCPRDDRPGGNRHAIALVSRTTRTVRSVSVGRGVGAALFDAGGAPYVQHAAAAERIEDPATGERRPLLANVLLVDSPIDCFETRTHQEIIGDD